MLTAEHSAAVLINKPLLCKMLLWLQRKRRTVQDSLIELPRGKHGLGFRQK